MLPLPVHNSDWRSYDQIANDYDRLGATRFEQVARAMAGMMPADCAPGALLDIGTGTGIVPAIFSEIFKTLHNIAGCDTSISMLQRAKALRVNHLLAAAVYTTVPFQNGKYCIG